MLWMYAPASRSNRSTTLGAMGAPPLYTFVSDDRSRPGHDASFINAMNTVIAPTVNVGRHRSIRSRVVTGSKRKPSTIGIGTKVAAIEQDFSQGQISTTNNPLDMAINGKGFFRLSDNGATSYTRTGQFHLDNAGFVVTSDNRNVTGYGVDALGNIVPTAPTNMRILNSQLPPTPTASEPTPPAVGV